MTWWKATSVTVIAGQSTVTVNAGDDIGMIKGAEGLVVGNQPPVEIKRSYLNASVMMLELMAPWPYATQSGQPAIAFPTDGDLAAATAVLKQLINGFAIATELEMQQATNNVNPASAFMVKKAIDFHRPVQTNPNDKNPNLLMKVGAFGLGADLASPTNTDNIEYNNLFFSNTANSTAPFSVDYYGLNFSRANGARRANLAIDAGVGPVRIGARRFDGEAWSPWVELRSTANTTVDSNGFLKAASPIVKLFNDKAILNGNFTANFDRATLGHYIISGTAGFADNGWYIETPKDANGNIKVFVEYEQLQDNTIVIKTYEPDYSNGKAAAGTPCDIPSNRWIDIRLKELSQVLTTSLDQ